MNNADSQIFRFFILVLVLAASCANPTRPTGGPKDELGPQLREKYPVLPPDRSLNVKEREVTFFFEEFLKTGNYRNDIFVSPLQQKPPDISVAGKKLKIKLKDALKPNTTYVITVGTGIKDFNEGNEMNRPIIYAFSTGNVLDSMKISGRVVNPLSGRGIEGISLLLYPEDSVQGHDIYEKKPVYVSQTDKNGNYSFYYLNRQSYKLYGVKDADRSYSYNQPSELLALTDEPLVSFPDTEIVQVRYLQLFQPDQRAPQAGTPRWIDSETFVIDFKEELRKYFKGDSIRIMVSDTFGNQKKEVEVWSKVLNEKKRGKSDGSKGKYLFWSPHKASVPVRISFFNLMDSLGNKTDTTLTLLPGQKDNSFEGKYFLPPEFDLQNMKIRLTATRPPKHIQVDSIIQSILNDSSSSRLKYNYLTDGYNVVVRLTNLPEKAGTYRLRIPSDFRFLDGTFSDSTSTFKIQIPGYETMGSVNGSVKPAGNWVIRLLDANNKTVMQNTGRKFSFPHVPEGKYKIQLVKDDDENGEWTPGSLIPYKLPEEIFLDSREIEVRGKWEVEDLIIDPVISETESQP